MARGGDRRSLYNEARHRVIVDGVRQGNYRGTAARMAGVSGDALRHWLDLGEKASFDDLPYTSQEGRYRQLFEDIEEAESQFEAEMVGRVVTAAEEPKNWAAAMTILERTRPEKFGKRETTVIEGGEKPVMTATLHIITNPEALSAANDMLKQLARPQRSEVPGDSNLLRELPGLESTVALVRDSSRV